MLKSLEVATSDRAYSVVIHGSVLIRGQCLARLLRDAGVSAIELPDDTIDDVLAAVPDLMIVSLHPDPLKNLQELRSRAFELGLKFPILGVGRIDRIDADFGSLRAAGVVGVIDARTGPDIAVARVCRQLGIGACGVQASERVQCLFPVSVFLGAVARRRSEFALNLSSTGMRLTTALPIDLNTSIGLRFTLPMVDRRVIEADARIVHCTAHRNSWGRWETGVFLTKIGPTDGAIVKRELGRLLAP